MLQRLKKFMLREMKTETVGETECVEHEYVPVPVMDFWKGLHDEEQCIRCKVVKPLDPFDNNLVEVD